MEIEEKPESIGSNGEQNLRLQVIEINKINTQALKILAIDLDNKQKDVDKVITENSDKDERHLIQAHLEGVWSQNHIVKQSIIHLLNPLYDEQNKLYSVNNTKGFLVLDPDSLLTCTLVASTLFCERKTWLNQIFLGVVGTNRAMLVGTLVHEAFQYGVKNRIADVDKLIAFLDEELDCATTMLEIYSVELHMRDVRAEAISYMKSVKEFIEKYMLTGPRYPLTNDSNLEVKIIGVSDIEENVWSTKYGLKGKIDVTGSVRVYDKRTNTVSDKIIPLELKTGNPNLSSSHAAQVSMYSMMIEDRYAVTNQGFVIYLKDKAAMHNVALTHGIKRDLIQRRNQINYHLKSFLFGPEMLDQPRLCSNCDRLTECVLMANIYTAGKIEAYPSLKALQPEATGHLDERFIEFFKKYHEKLSRVMSNNGSLEKTDKLNSGCFWNFSSEEAELKGTGFGKLQASLNSNGKSGTNFVTFKRHPRYLDSLTDLDDELNGDSLKSDSSENGTPQQASKKQKIMDYFKPVKRPSQNSQGLKKKNKKPFNTELNFSRCRVAISVDCEDVDMDRQNSSTAIAIGFMSELNEDHFVMKLYEGALDSLKPDMMYRVDKVEKRTNVDIERLVLARLLMRDDWRCDRVRQLILNPKMEPLENIEFNLYVMDTGFDEVTELESKEQKLIVEAVSTDNYYILSEKMESNKTKIHKTISVLTKLICNLSRSVLIVAQNIDSLVDLMRALQNKKIKFIIIDDGKSTKARYQYASNLVKVPQNDKLDLERKFDSYIRQHEMSPVVITTYAMSIGGLLFTRKTYDYCICYDCDTTELLVSLSPMFCSDRYIILDIKDTPNKTTNGDCDKTTNGVDSQDISLGDHLRSLRPHMQIYAHETILID